jgi:putative hydrolase of the HAD superfamily
MATTEFTIGFDADDTLWHNETNFARVHERFRALLAQYHEAATVDAALLETERRNVPLYGYGIKGFTLSAVETAIQLTDGKISAGEVQQLIELGRGLLDCPVELFDGVVDTLTLLAERLPLIVITKGDLRDQERKIAKSGLAGRFRAVEIVSEKDEATYAAILRRHGIAAERFLMVGNSVKSDILPVIELGGASVHIPHHLTWALEHAHPPVGAEGRFFSIAKMAELPPVVSAWASAHR